MTNPVYPQQIILYAFILNNSTTKAFKLEFSEVYLRPSFNILNYFITYIYLILTFSRQNKRQLRRRNQENRRHRREFNILVTIWCCPSVCLSVVYFRKHLSLTFLYYYLLLVIKLLICYFVCNLSSWVVQ